MAKRQATIQDIAKALEITASTVSRALNDHPKISKKTKELVWDMAKKLNYQPNSIAAGLRKGKVNTVGMIVPRINRHFFSNVITGVESILNPLGYNLIICQSEEQLEKEINNVNTLLANRVSGILISLSVESQKTKHLKKIIDNKVPLVMFDRVHDEMEVSKVVNDDDSGSYDVTCHLLDQGYKNITWIGGPRTMNVYINRYTGYERALKENGIDMATCNCLEGTGPTMDEGARFTKELIASDKLPDAIFAASDYMAMGIIETLEAAGYNIPDDIAVAGYSNEPFAGLISPKLTSVEQFSKDMGMTAARLLVTEMESEQKTVPMTTSLKPQLIIRQSTIKKR